ncbi:MAG: universal stress protein [Myxococcales bacterium]|nr:universal stress protein [Myxococcales bacterium]
MLTIAHATALSSEDTRPFEHSVALAHRSGATLCSVHAGSEPPNLMPEATDLLKRWHIADEVRHQRMSHTCCDDPVDTVLDALKKLSPDLVVCATHQRSGVFRIFMDSRAESLANNLRMPTLLFPIGAPGFVSSDTGAVDLHRMVIPVGDAEAARAAVDKAVWLGEMAKSPRLEMILLHVGEGAAPRVDVPIHEGWTARAVQADGDLEAVIAAYGAEDHGGTVVVMATRGHDSVGDVLVGSHTERVLRIAKCPVLMVPLA